MAKKPLHTGFAGLKAMRQALQEQRRAEAVAQAAREAAAVDARRAANEFRHAMGDVTPLATTARFTPAPASPPPLPFKRWEDDKAVLRESLSDEYGADWLIETDETLSYRRSGLGQDVVRNLRRGQWVVGSQIDLHGCRVDEAREALSEFLRDCVKREVRCVRVIHGKGLGSKNRTPVLKEKVRRWLVQKEQVLAFVEARDVDGGAGVVLVLLRSRRAEDVAA
ncbi:Smr/MutS family protein [Pigmentiphaga aceris]|nr:Smr/MutS family protein [Pigmentiphaga aceris]